MKNFKFLIIMLMFVFASCETHQKELQHLAVQNSVLSDQNSSKDEQINGFLSDFASIEQNLNTIKEKENIVTLNVASQNLELGSNRKDLINADIREIYNLMLKNKEIIASLNKKLRDSNIKMEGVDNMISILAKQVGE